METLYTGTTDHGGLWAYSWNLAYILSIYFEGGINSICHSHDDDHDDTHGNTHGNTDGNSHGDSHGNTDGDSHGDSHGNSHGSRDVDTATRGVVDKARAKAGACGAQCSLGVALLTGGEGFHLGHHLDPVRMNDIGRCISAWMLICFVVSNE